MATPVYEACPRSQPNSQCLKMETSTATVGGPVTGTFPICDFVVCSDSPTTGDITYSAASYANYVGKSIVFIKTLDTTATGNKINIVLPAPAVFIETGTDTLALPDAPTSLVLYFPLNGDVVGSVSSSLGGGAPPPSTNVYNTNGTVTNHRTVNCNNNNFTINNTPTLTLDSTNQTYLTGPSVFVGDNAAGSTQIQSSTVRVTQIATNNFNSFNGDVPLVRSSATKNVTCANMTGFAASLAADETLTTVGPHTINNFAVSLPGEYNTGALTGSGYILPQSGTGLYEINFSATLARTGGTACTGSFVLETVPSGIIYPLGSVVDLTSTELKSVSCSAILQLDSSKNYRIRLDFDVASNVVLYAPDFSLTPKMRGTSFGCRSLF